MHPIDIATKEHHELSTEGRAGWWILMALVATTILVVAIVMATPDAGAGHDPQQSAQVDEGVDPAS